MVVGIMLTDGVGIIVEPFVDIEVDVGPFVGPIVRLPFAHCVFRGFSPMGHRMRKRPHPAYR